MDGTLTTLLEEEIIHEFEKLRDLTPVSREQTIAINNVIKLYRLRMDEEKGAADIQQMKKVHELSEQKQKDDVASDVRKWNLDMKKLESEAERNNKEASKERREAIVNWCIRICELALPLVFYAAWMKRGFEFERNGTFTSTTFRGLFNNFKPTKK